MISTRFHPNFLSAILSVTILMLDTSLSRNIQHEFTGLRLKSLKAKADRVTEEIPHTDLITCVAACSSKTSCLALSWHGQDKTCLHSNTKITNDAERFAFLESDENWNTMEKMLFTVFSARKVWNEGLTFEEARQLCIERDTQLAEYADLVYSYNLGYDWDKCHWVKNGSLHFPDQYLGTIGECNENDQPHALCVLN